MSLPLAGDRVAAAPPFGVPRAIATGIEWLRLPLPFPPHHVNVYRIASDGNRFLVDTGFRDEATTGLWRALGMPAADRVIVTHFHPDHIGQAAAFEAAGARIYLAAAELTQARALCALADAEMETIFTNFFASQGLRMPAEVVDGNRYRRAVPALPARAGELRTGPVPFAGEWRADFAGGHSPAHALLFRAEPPALAAGDILLPDITPNISVWPDDPEADPLAHYLQALARLRELPPETLVLPAHGNPGCGLHERVAAIEEHHRRRLNLLREAARGGRSLRGADAIAILFPADLKAASLPFALGEALAHLNRLWHAGEFERIRDAAGIFCYAPRG
ncbi:MAG TPA: MBL fold metallo-hydrolase [Gammaproteobacteria bacterium]|nr:MBL fold metallo-hydrolase [Gammaproteobacteria bacterium]